MADGRRLNNCHSRAHFIWQTHRINDQARVFGTRAQLDEQYLVFIMVEQGMQFRFQFFQSQIIQRALEYRVLQARAKAFQRTCHFTQPFRVGDVITHEITNTAHARFVRYGQWQMANGKSLCIRGGADGFGSYICHFEFAIWNRPSLHSSASPRAARASEELYSGWFGFRLRRKFNRKSFAFCVMAREARCFSGK